MSNAPQYLYTIACTRSPRGTAGAAAKQPHLRESVRALGGQVHAMYVSGPYLYAQVSLTPGMVETIMSEWVGIESVIRQYGEGVGS